MRRLSAYRVFLTQQSEYHIRGHVCFGVRNRRTGEWIVQHWALTHALADAFPDGRGHMCSLSLPAVGQPLRFLVGGELLETSPVLAVEEREFLLAPLRSVKPRWVALASGDARDTH